MLPGLAVYLNVLACNFILKSFGCIVMFSFKLNPVTFRSNETNTENEQERSLQADDIPLKA